MHRKLYALLNIKPSEYAVVKQLFLVQLFLGIATAFLFTSTLTLFLHTLDVHYIPKVYLFSAFLLLLANWGYSKLEHSYSSRQVLQFIIFFSAGSLLLTWAGITFIKYKWLPFLLSAWNLVVFMLVGYAFWGMTAIIFNVRESKRIFSLVGSGDLPAKLIGYALVPVLIPFIGVNNLLWFSVLAFALAYYFLSRFQHAAIDQKVTHKSHAYEQPNLTENSFINRLFHNRLILYISLFSLVAFTIYAFTDYTLLVEVKSRFEDSPDLAIFIGMFFAAGRVLAIFFKVFFSSRIITTIGLANSLLITPVILLLITGILFLPGESERAILYTFGIMVLLSEVLKSVVQEPAFFILFQPLGPHIRLKGHLIAKGYMMPFALIVSGLFLLVWGDTSILFIGEVLVCLLVVWIATIFLVKKAYLDTLVQSIKKGWFTGSELFLNDASVKELLLSKMESANPKEIIVSLELLERSGDKQINEFLIRHFSSELTEVRRYALVALLRLKVKDVVPLVAAQLDHNPDDALRPELLKAYYTLRPDLPDSINEILYGLSREDKRAVLTGLLARGEPEADKLVLLELDRLAHQSSEPQDKYLALDVISASEKIAFETLLETLLLSCSEQISKQAVIAVGKLKAYTLLRQIIRIVEQRNLYAALQTSLVHFGDDVFAASEVQPAGLQTATIKAIIAAAGKVRGDSSTQYLLHLLKTNWPEPDYLISALWLKQEKLTGENKVLVEQWLSTKLSSCQLKIQTLREVQLHDYELVLLAEALQSELKQDAEKVIKGLALCFDRPRIDRVNKLLQLGEAGKVANAIEILEHTVPQPLFKEVDKLLDFTLDGSSNFPGLARTKKVPDILITILTDDDMKCSAWTRAVACYLIPAFASPALLHIVNSDTLLPEDVLFQDTKAYVLSELA